MTERKTGRQRKREVDKGNLQIQRGPSTAREELSDAPLAERRGVLQYAGSEGCGEQRARARAGEYTSKRAAAPFQKFVSFVDVPENWFPVSFETSCRDPPSPP